MAADRGLATPMMLSGDVWRADLPDHDELDSLFEAVEDNVEAERLFNYARAACEANRRSQPAAQTVVGSRIDVPDQQKKWYVVDADGLVLGRLASILANMLRGKHKPTFTPYMDCGDHVVVINAEKVKRTSYKGKVDIFYNPELYNPERVIRMSVERMVPRSPLGRKQMSHLKVYKGEVHPHAAQQPAVLNVGTLDPKTKRSA